MYNRHTHLHRVYALVAACVLTSACCSTHLPYSPDICMRVRIDPQFTPAERQAVELAVTRWEQALGRPIACATGPFLSISRGNELIGEYLDRRLSIEPGRTFGESHLGSVHSGDTVWVMSDRIACHAERTGDDAQWLTFEVTAHELGHVLGLPHTERPGSIMRATVTDAPRTWWVPAEDAAGVR